MNAPSRYVNLRIGADQIQKREGTAAYHQKPSKTSLKNFLLIDDRI